MATVNFDNMNKLKSDIVQLEQTISKIQLCGPDNEIYMFSYVHKWNLEEVLEAWKFDYNNPIVFDLPPDAS